MARSRLLSRGLNCTACLLTWFISQGSPVLAQYPAHRAVSGGVYQGRYIGFVPRHQQNAVNVAPPVEEVMTAQDMAEEMAMPHDGGVQPADFTPESQLAEAVPEALVFDAFVHGAPGEHLACGPASCYPVPRLFGGADYLLWWTKGMDTPPLVTSSRSGIPQERAGVLGDPATSVRFGDGSLMDESRSGVQLHLGWWLDECHEHALEFSYLTLGSESVSYSESEDDRSILGRPFINLPANEEDARLIAYPGLVDGTIGVEASSDFQTFEVLLRHQAPLAYRDMLDISLGYRYASLQDSLSFRESTTSLSGPTQNTKIDLDEQFGTDNSFHGGQLGLRLTPCRSPIWSLELAGKIALGNTQAESTIAGQTKTTVPTGESSTQPAGLLAQRTNIGTWEDSQFSTITEGGVTLRRRLPWNLSFVTGYSVLFWTNVARAGDQIDRSINTTQIPPGTLSGDPRPAPTENTTDFWAQGLRFGLEYNY